MHETPLHDQFRSWGVIFPNIYPGSTNSPRVIYDPDGTTISKFGILVSGGPTGFFGNIEMDFVGPSLPNFVTMEIIGSGLSIGASIKAFNPDGVLLGAATEFYYGSTGRDFPVTFFAPGGETIARVIYNGGINPTTAASIDNLSFGSAPTSVPEPPTMLLLGFSLIGLIGFRRKSKR